MIEMVMGFSLGFLAASLLIVIVIPLVHHRAVRLTTEKLLGAVPVSVVEVQASKDLLRAQFAMSAYRLETRLEAMRTRTTALLAEIGRKAAEIGRLKIELGRQSSLILAFEARERVRKSMARRVATLMLVFARSYRRRVRLLAEQQGGLQTVDAPPLQNIAIEPGSPQAEPLWEVTARPLVQPDVAGTLPSCLSDRGAPTEVDPALHQTAVAAMATVVPLQRSLN